MPRRERRSKRAARLALSARTDLALTIGPDDPRDDDLTDDLLIELYVEHRDRYDDACWGFWRFEPDVPAELRAERDELVPLVTDPPEVGRRQLEQLEAARRLWLGSRRAA